MSERITTLNDREDKLLAALAEVYAAQARLRDAHLIVKELSFATEIVQAAEAARGQMLFLERILAIDVHHTRRGAQDLLPPVPVPDAPWFNEAREKLEAGIRGLAMHGFTGTLNLGKAKVEVRL